MKNIIFLKQNNYIFKISKNFRNQIHKKIILWLFQIKIGNIKNCYYYGFNKDFKNIFNNLNIIEVYKYIIIDYYNIKSFYVRDLIIFNSNHKFKLFIKNYFWLYLNFNNIFPNIY